MKEVPEENTNTRLLFYVDQDFKSKNSGAWLSNVKKSKQSVYQKIMLRK